jgi:serine O-acetyltransferase
VWGHDRLAAVWSGLGADIQRYLNKSPENRAAGDNLKTRVSASITPQLHSLVLYRLSHWLAVNGWAAAGHLLSDLNMFIHKVNIPADSCIGPGCFLPHPAGVTFYGVAGCGLTLYSRAVSTPAWDGRSGPPVIGDRVLLGGHAWTCGPIAVGSDTTVSYMVPLRRDAAPGSLVIAPEAWGREISRRLSQRRAG